MTQTSSERPYQFIDHARPASPYDYPTGCHNSQATTEQRPQAYTLRAIVNRENLVCVLKKRRNSSGQGPGIDGVTFSNISISEFADVAETVCELIYEGRWRPRRSRRVGIPKDGGRPRPIDMRCLVDKMVSSAVAEETADRIDPILALGCYGYRKNRCIHGLFAEIAYRAEVDGLTVIAQDDIENAFPSVRIAHAVEDYSRHVIDPGLLHLIEVILRGHDQSRERGMDQGDPLSPPTFIQRLNNVLNLPTSLSTDSDTTQRYWYADNFVYQSRSVTEAQQALQLDRDLLQQHELPFKGEGNFPVDLRRTNSRAYA